MFENGKWGKKNGPASYLCVPAQLLHLHLTLCEPMDSSPPGSSVLGILQTRILEGVCHALLQGIFPTQRWNPSLMWLLHYRQVLYH